jgi:mRNA-decapping enzyme subunit 2
MISSSSSSSSPEVSPAMAADSDPDRSSFKYDTREDAMDDLTSRFILNLPDDELASLERVCFQVEQAHWYYEDFIRENNPQFPSLPLKRFSEELFNYCPLLHQWQSDHEQAFNTFMRYKTRVPVCGAIMLNSKWDKCVLVKGWKSSSGWGFPKGKINESESKPNCATREVLEETGYNLAGQINPAHVIEVFIREQSISLYIVPDVPEDYLFETKTRKEISRIEWFKLSDLPTWKRNKTCQGKFYLISPFIAKLKEFINFHKPRSSPRKGVRVKKAPPQTDASQESSSQSSDPHTPSPRSTELLPNVADPEDNERTATPVHDPHMAFLLSKLNGVGGLLGSSKSGSVSLKQMPVSAPVDEERRTPIPTSSSLAPSQTLTAMDSKLSIELQTPTTAPLAHATPTAHIPRPLSTSIPERVAPVNGYFNLNVPSPHLSSNASTTSARQRSQRTKSTADISPYLSRAGGGDSVSRQLRQISLLENIAQDIARRAVPELPPPPAPGQWRPALSPYDGALPPQPAHQASVYSSSDPFVHGPPPPPRPYSVMNDPFHVQDRNHLASFGRPGTTSDPSRAQLLSLMCDRPGTSLRNHPQYGAPYPSFSGSVPYHTSIPPICIPTAPSYSALPPRPTSLNLLAQPSPTLFPSNTVSQNTTASSGNLHLLSLLNSNQGSAPSNA